MRRVIPQIAAWALLLGVCAAVAGCGNDRTAAPDVAQPRPPAGSVTVHDAASGIAFRAPRNWRPAVGAASPLVTTIVSGSATVAVWRYPRAEKLPAGDADLETARADLLASVKRRDPRSRIKASKLTEHAGDRAILLLGTEHIAGRLRQVKSLHVFAHGGEVVVDVYAPPASFAGLDRSVFAPLIASLKIAAPKRA
jgi:hypothetical protein